MDHLFIYACLDFFFFFTSFFLVVQFFGGVVFFGVVAHFIPEPTLASSSDVKSKKVLDDAFPNT